MRYCSQDEQARRAHAGRQQSRRALPGEFPSPALRNEVVELADNAAIVYAMAVVVGAVPVPTLLECQVSRRKKRASLDTIVSNPETADARNQ